MRSQRTVQVAAAAATTAIAALGVSGALAATHRAGTLDRSFGHRGVAVLPAGTRLLGVAAERDGGAVAVGETGISARPLGSNARLLLVRFTRSGALDRRFGHRGIVTGPAVRNPRGSGSLGRAVAVEPNGKIVVVGTATDRTGTANAGILVERFTAGGGLDRSFGSHGVELLLSSQFGNGYGVALAPGGRILASGSADASGSGGGTYPRSAVVRLTASGRPDRRFGKGGTDIVDLGPYSTALAVASAPGGRIVIAGSQSPGLQAVNALVARLTSSGRLDHGFDGSGYYARQLAAAGGAASAFNAVAVVHGRVVAAGAATAGGGRALALVEEFSGSGHPVGSFGSRGVATTTSATSYLAAASTGVPGAYGLAAGPRGELIAVGRSSNGVLSSAAVWTFTSRGHAHGSVKVGLGTGEQGEAAGVAAVPGGAAVVVGDESVIGQRPDGFAARLALGR